MPFGHLYYSLAKVTQPVNLIELEKSGSSNSSEAGACLNWAPSHCDQSISWIQVNFMIDSSESSRCVWLSILKLLDHWTEPWNRILHSQHLSSSSPRSYISVYCRAGIIITASEASTWKLILFLSDGLWIIFSANTIYFQDPARLNAIFGLSAGWFQVRAETAPVWSAYWVTANQ